MDVKANVNLFTKPGNLKGIASVALDDDFIIKNVRVFQGEKGLFVSMPSQKIGDEYKDICFAKSQGLRDQISEAVLSEYDIALKQANSHTKEQKHEEKQEHKTSKSTQTKASKQEQSQKNNEDISQENGTEEIEEGPVMSM